MADGNDRLPLTQSLESEVLSAFAVAPRGEALSTERLISALEDLDTRDRSLADSLTDAGFMQPSAEDQAKLDWVDAAFSHWARQYPLAPELQNALDGARGLAAAFALADTRFFIPGGHALHRLLDVIHNGLLGWHSGLGNSALGALQGMTEAIERSRRDFPSEPQVDETVHLLAQKLNGHEEQLKRLDSALLEREAATLGGNLSKFSAAMGVNAILAAHQVPGSVARFLKSDWFESGVLIVEQHGVDSSEWDSFINTTQLLVDAVQPVDQADPDGQKRLQMAMQQLPGTLSRQLLSLHPDNDAVAGAVGLIEYALLRNMRGEDLGLMAADPISVDGMPDQGLPTDQDLAQHHIHPGNWYALDTPEGEIRVRLVGGLAGNAYLLFMNFLGARTLRKTYGEFKILLGSGEARNLTVPDSFCRAMAEATETRRLVREQEMTAQAEQRAQEEAEAERATQEMAATLSGQARQQSEAPAEPSAQTPQTTRQQDAGSVPSKDDAYERNTVVKLQIPMGTWMGFHDRDPPLMARVAVRDREKDSYIFTDREGIKLRELTVAQLIALIDRDMVDILERKTNFRETVNQMRQDQERLAHS